MPERVLVAMSGGVDSSVAAALLVEQGCEVRGVTLQLWGKDVCVSAGSRLCCSVRDALDARQVARRLGIPHETLELEGDFRTHVIDYFVGSYAEGLTPNPCIACNNHIKFGSLFAYAEQRGASAVATGHYARRETAPGGRWRLRRAADETKDQSYVLFGLTQAQLARARFPLGAMTKAAVRETAKRLGFVTAEKPDSQDVCFIRDRNTSGFLRTTLGDGAVAPGPITDTAGRVLGEHRGLLGYTIGQREGLGVAAGRPLYVVAMDREANRLVVGGREELLRSDLEAERFNWVSMEPPTASVRAAAKIRSRHVPAPCRATPGAGGRVRLTFDEPQAAITPGQAVVLYQDDVLLGGGWISAERGTPQTVDAGREARGA